MTRGEKLFALFVIGAIFVVVTAIGWSYMEWETNREAYLAACKETKGKPVFNGKYMECLK